MKKSFWILLFITTISIFSNIGTIPLLDPDEPVYGETPKEMIQFNDFISPRIYGEFWYDKPPMYYWLVAAAFKVFGVNEFAVRLPSALFGVICVVGVYLEVAKLFNERTGLISGLVLATSLEYFYLAKAAVTDITLTLFLTGALLAFLRRQYYFFYVCSALATLTKGPIGLLFPIAIIFIWMTITQRFGELKHMKIPQGIFILSLVLLPWYGVMYYIHGADFLEGFIGINNIARFTTAEHEKTSGWYFFMPILILGFFPWTALIFQAIKESLKIKGTNDYSTLVFLNIWAMFIFVFFSISNTKLVTYILPVYPPLAILVGWYLNYHWEDYHFSGQGLVWPILLTILSVLFIGGLIAEVTIITVIKWGALSLACVLFLMIILVWYFLYKKEVCKAFVGQVGSMVTFCIILFNVILPQITDNYNMRDIARKFVAVYDGKSSVYVEKFLHPGFAFYANAYGKEINSETEIRKITEGEEKAYLLIRQAEYQGLSNLEKATMTILASSNDKLLLLYKAENNKE